MTIQVELVCPLCHNSEFTVRDTKRMADGTRKRYRLCASCGSTRSIRTREILESTYQRLIRLVNGG